MSRSANVLCLNGRRRTVKFSSNTTVAQILEDVCNKERINSAEYDLRTVKCILDRTLPWNHTNLPNNAKLELCTRNNESQPAVANVKIALQLPGGQRLTDEFSTNSFLSEIVEHFSRHINDLLNPAPGDDPEFVYMRQKLTGQQILKSTNLQSLGIIKGSALMRFSYQPPSSDNQAVTAETDNLQRNTSQSSKPAIVLHTKQTPQDSSDINCKNKSGFTVSDQYRFSARLVTSGKLKQDSMYPDSSNNPSVQDKKLNGKVEKSRTFSAIPSKRLKDVSKEVQNLPVNSDGVQRIEFLNFKFPKETEGRHLYNITSPSSINGSQLSTPCDRKPMLFNEMTLEVDTVRSEEPDDFFEVTVDDLRKMMEDLKYARNKLEEQELLTDEQRKYRRLQLATKYPYIVIRIVFPDRMILQGLFRPLEKVSSMYKFVQEHVAVTSFYLFTTPPKQLLRNKDSSLFDSNLAPAARVYFGTDVKLNAGYNLIKNASPAILCTAKDANKEILNFKE